MYRISIRTICLQAGSEHKRIQHTQAPSPVVTSLCNTLTRLYYTCLHLYTKVGVLE